MKKQLILAFSAVLIFACTDLEENLDGLSEESGLADQEIVSGGIASAYNQLRSFQTVGNQYVLQQHSSDEMAGPTRGADWDDGGAWRALHLHLWNSSHPNVNNTWNQLLGGLFPAINALSNNPNIEDEAVATFYLSFYMFNALDIFGQVPFREPGSDYADDPIVLSRIEAVDYAITALEAVFDNLPAIAESNSANKYSAATLLAKLYLNRAVYKATDEDGTPQAGPYTFDATDMQKVIDYCDIIMAGPYSLQSTYFDMFAPNNTDLSTEDILVSENSNNSGGNLRELYLMTLHYNQGGWNGFVGLTDLYEKFDDSDARRGGSYPGLTDVSGINAGMLVGQQYDENGVALEDRQGNPLNYTQEFEIANTTEVRGMRVIKYLPDYENVDRPANDYVVFRLADVYLMKAEAMARMGGDPSALLTELRTARGVETVYTGTTLADILDERSRELYWEGWRRNDQIRFGTFLNPVQEKPETSDRTRLVFPIPATALSTNPNLKQNPGY
ncbi:RagB/SusD family nutrient uptake outer membrane protein [uncultured Winogradskyella sp.]|uniref:RagB/SusD family nutrient uptake outer membrane protein n=1 Tax=uncultured Winogradskyella sp. TaxID=395353 RepID=UPI00260C99B7|nr:RagB/SusD family nutrient uptake outer membrane protein [uncultured Winogradskyella sp.]